MAPVFRALGDANRRVLLDRLFERDGQTLGELCEALPGMTRFGETAGLISTRRVGREKRHYLDPVPIRFVHDRWTGKFAESIVGPMTALKRHLEAPMNTVDHVYSVYIKAPADRIWRAITDGDETVRYYYGTRVSSTWEVGAPISYTYPDGSVAADGSVLEIEPGRRVVMSFHPRWDPDIEAAGPIRMTWAIEAGEDDGKPSRLIVTSALVPGSKTEQEFSGGVVYIVSGLKTAIETGASMAVA
jgi:uncharacterized protein YndB with AHSA1/START domain